ncbi:MAG: ABC transporter ATP-binding protein, partial [Gammaproteobacteria bacterium]|nr:ABC transporter ATP-binding protein [Gammaproteobacteria bacterium]
EATLDRKKQKQLEAQLRQALAPLKKQSDQLERAVNEQQRKLAEIETRMSDPELYNDNQKDTLTQLIADQSKLKAQLEADEERWFEVQQALEEKREQLAQEITVAS